MRALVHWRRRSRVATAFANFSAFVQPTGVFGEAVA